MEITLGHTYRWHATTEHVTLQQHVTLILQLQSFEHLYVMCCLIAES